MSGMDQAGPASPTARAEAAARRHGLPSFGAWRAALERRYTVMPPWYWNDRHCRENYISHVRAAIDWQQRERRINRGNAAFLGSLGR
jgi:hypothetical protein